MEDFSRDFGILYVATGCSYIDEAIVSARRTRSWVNCPICIVTDQINFAGLTAVFDIVVQHQSPEFSYRDKVSALSCSPFKHTLFLDTDAFLVYKASDIFSYLSHVDLSAAFAPVRHPPGWSDSAVPLAMAELNTGVIYFRKSRKVLNLFHAWLMLYDNLKNVYNQSWDQASFRSIFWKFLNEKNLSFLPLTTEFNLRTPKPWIAGRGQHVYVIHGRFPESELELFENYLNSDIDRFRTFSEWISLYPDTSIRPKFDRQIIL